MEDATPGTKSGSDSAAVNDCPHSVNITAVAIQELGLEVIPHQPHCPDLAPPEECYELMDQPSNLHILPSANFNIE